MAPVSSGMLFFPPSCPSHYTYSDASGSYGCGAFEVSSGWFKVRWPNHWVMSSIAIKEFVPIVIAVANGGRTGKVVMCTSIPITWL